MIKLNKVQFHLLFCDYGKSLPIQNIFILFDNSQFFLIYIKLHKCSHFIILQESNDSRDVREVVFWMLWN